MAKVKKKAASRKVKTFVLDTNVLLHDPQALESFVDNIIVLPMAVIEELDKFKTHNDELGRSARQTIRRLDKLRENGNLRDGVPIAHGGKLRIVSASHDFADAGLEHGLADNRILQVAYGLHGQGERVIFVSKDINARVKCDALGLDAQDYERSKVNFDELYSGYGEVVTAKRTVDTFFKKTVMEMPRLGGYPNQFLTLRDRSNPKRTALARVLQPGVLTHLTKTNEKVWNITSRNKEQRLALELLMDPEVQIVTLVGKAGTGKTLLALAAALHKTLRNGRYDRILVSRPVIPMGKDIGYLPGAKEEKMSHWMQPIFDNLTFLLREEIPGGKAKRKAKPASVQDRIDRLLKEGTIEMEALTYIRGRSIPRQYVIIDEAQNLTPHEVKTIISRAGEGTKMVLTGDPFQIDNPYLDASSNGLTYAAERLKEQEISGHITLHSSERSKLAAIAAEYL